MRQPAAAAGGRIFNPIFGYLEAKLKMPNPYEGRKVRQKGVNKGDWVFFSLTKSSGCEYSLRILALARVEEILDNQGGEWSVSYCFKRVYEIKSEAYYTCTQCVLDNPYGVSSNRRQFSHDLGPDSGDNRTLTAAASPSK